MNRREAIRNVIILGAGASLLASCQDNPSILLKNIPLSGSQENLLAAMTEAILPTTDFIGAKELESHKFALMMTDDVAAPEDQTNFMTGMLQFEEACKKKYGKRFIKCTAQEKEEFLLLVESKTDEPEEIVGFYKTVKRYTIQSFTTSEAYLTQVRNFSLIRGPYKGCVPITSI